MSSRYAFVLPTIVVVLLIVGWERVLAAESGVMQQLHSPLSPAASGGRQRSTALLLALQNGQNGENHLREWITYAQSKSAMDLPPVWVVCLENSTNYALVSSLAPQFQPFVVHADASWGAVLKTFALQVWQSNSGSTLILPWFSYSVWIALDDIRARRVSVGPNRTIFFYHVNFVPH